MPLYLIVIIVFAIISLAIIVLAYFCFDDVDPDLYWNANYGECHRPYVALKDTCPHTEKTDKVVWTGVTCETIHTVCDACTKVLKVRTECC